MADCSHWSQRNQLPDHSEVLPAPAFQDTGLMDEISIHPSQESVFPTFFQGRDTHHLQQRPSKPWTRELNSLIQKHDVLKEGCQRLPPSKENQSCSKELETRATFGEQIRSLLDKTFISTPYLAAELQLRDSFPKKVFI